MVSRDRLMRLRDRLKFNDGGFAISRSGAAHEIDAILAALDTPATEEEARECLARIRSSMAMLQQHAEGCAQNHYGEDFSLFGMPGWLADTRADLDRLTALTTLRSSGVSQKGSGNE